MIKAKKKKKKNGLMITKFTHTLYATFVVLIMELIMLYHSCTYILLNAEWIKLFAVLRYENYEHYLRIR